MAFIERVAPTNKILYFSTMSPSNSPRPQHIHFLVFPEFSFLSFISAIEPLRVANHLREDSYRWHVLSVDGGPILASNGLTLPAEGSFMDADSVSMVFVLSGFNTLSYFRPELGRWLRSARGQGATLGAIGGGAFVLAEAKLLDNCPVALHWGYHTAFAERYPTAKLSPSLFEIEARCITCAGGTTGIDLMLALIQRTHGHDLATKISDWFILGRIRKQIDPQRMAIETHYGVHNDKTIQVIKLMQAHIEDPLSPHDLANAIDVTVRQLERLFHSHLGLTPSNFYLQIRLDRGRELLQLTSLSVAEISVACGFGSSSYFCRAYRARFGITPKEDRVELKSDHKQTRPRSRSRATT